MSISKISKKELTDRVASQLITYLGSGRLNPHALARSIDFSGLNISNLDRLKELHFVLSEDVRSYVAALPERLRRVKTVNQQERSVTRGEVRGRIEWSATHRQRYREGYDDPTLFVVSNPEIEYDIPENRVLKKLLSVIERPLSRDIEGVDRSWRDRWDDGAIIALQQTLARNVYLSRLPNPEEITLSARDLDRTRRSRAPLYTEAQRLYRLYEDLLNDRTEDPEIQELLTETLVLPQQTYRLFELYFLFGVITRFRSRYPNLTLRRISTGSGAIAVLDDSTQRIEVYHDESGPLSFFEAYPRRADLQDPAIPEMVRRHADALEQHADLVEEFIDQESSRKFYDGRPDLLALRYQKVDRGKELKEAIIGEAKHTRSSQKFSEGLRELMEYIHFAKEHKTYLFGSDTAESVDITGLLCTDGVKTNVDSIENIHHLRTAELDPEASVPAVKGI